MTSSAATFNLNLLECCSATTLPKSHFPTNFSKSFFSIPQIHSLSSSISLKSKNLTSRIVPFVAETSDWTQEGEETLIESESEEGAEEAGGAIQEETKIFVGNLSFTIDSEQLAELFNQAGVVEVAEVIYNRQTDRSRGFGFVTMSTAEETEKAVEMFNGYELDGRVLTVNIAAPRGSQPPARERVPRSFEPSCRMYVGNLPWQVDDGRLEQVFSEHGKVVNARVVYDRESGRSRGFGFVTMSSESEVNDAIASLDGQDLDGRAIRVNVAEERPRRAF